MLNCSAAGTKGMGIMEVVSRSIMLDLSNSHLLGQLTTLANSTLSGCRGADTSFSFKHLPKLEALIGS